MSQKQKDYQVPKPKEIKEDYQGPKKMDEAHQLLDGIDDLIAQDNLADSYKQSSGQ